MVNSKALLTSGVMTLAVAGIVTYMQMNGLTTDDISLVDACYKSASVNGINVETCDQFKEWNTEWDTKIPCVVSFKENTYFWTPRMMFQFYAGEDTEIQSLGRKNKGEEFVQYEPTAMNMSLADALYDRCGEAVIDPAFNSWKYQGRETAWWVTKVITKGVIWGATKGKKAAKKAAKISAKAIKSSYNAATGAVTDATNYAAGVAQAGWDYGEDAAQNAISDVNSYVSDVQSGLIAATQFAPNYRACSLGLAMKAVNPNMIDTAECSGKNPGQCKRYHQYGGNWGWWTNNKRGTNNRLNSGCVAHDQCLNAQEPNWNDTISGQCDVALSLAAHKCIAWRDGKRSCGWRGCRFRAAGYKYSCGDSRSISSSVHISMATTPNGP
jgi:hypothetical protein